MKVEAMYRPEVFTIESDESLAAAASTMHFNEVGALPVFDDGRFTGIITERDLVRALAEDEDPQSTTVREYMTPDPVSITPDTSLGQAADRMLQMGVRHLPVLLAGEVVGMVSVRDLLVEVDA
jgi:CBS domain-containing protein